MSDEPVGTDALAVLVADGHSIDWEAALNSASEEERRLIHQLRLVESIARAHASAESSPLHSPAPRAAVPTMDETSVSEPSPAKRTWGHLELREKIGEGGFGEVYRAWDPRLDREVALKLLKSEASIDQATASRFIDEGRLLAKLHHPNVVTVYGAEVHEARVGLWMEFIRGRSLEQLLREGGLFGAREAASIGIDLCRALGAVHRAGVIHRDVKAQNAMREAGGRILLTDFGAGIEVRAGTNEKQANISGTPLYMASELVRGEPATQRSDIYSLGVLLYRLVTGAFPIEVATWQELRDKHARRESKLLRDQRQDLPDGFVAVIERALAWDPEARFATAGQMEQALSQALGTASPSWSDHEPAPAEKPKGASSRRTWILGGTLLIAVVAVFAILRDRRGAPEVPPTLPAPASATSPPAPTPLEPPVVPASAPYTVEAALYRTPATPGGRERLAPGARLVLGDRLTLEFKASVPLFVYVINEDEAGHSYALFPLPDLDIKNPLRASVMHLLPGSRGGKDLSWTVDTPGGREHVMVLASPTRLVEFEAEMNALARPGQIAASIPEAAKVHLRGIGRLTEGSPVVGGGSARPLFEMADRLVARSEVVQGIWMRRIELENPRP